MLIADLLRHKGSTVVTIAPDGLVTDLLASLAEHKIGAVVVAIQWVDDYFKQQRLKEFGK